MIQALVGSKVLEDRGLVEAYSVASLAPDLPFRVSTAYGYLAFSMQNLDTSSAVANALRHAVANQHYRQILEGLGMQAVYIDASTYLERMMGIGTDRCRDVCV